MADQNRRQLHPYHRALELRQSQHSASRQSQLRSDAGKISQEFQNLLAERRLNELSTRRSRQLASARHSSRTPFEDQSYVLEPTHSTLHNIPKIPVRPNVNDTRSMRFCSMLKMLSVTPEKYENPGLLDEALSIIPLDRIYNEADEEHSILVAQARSIAEAKGEGEDGIQKRTKWGLQDCVIKALLKWYKNSYMTWVNNPPCSVCGSPTVAIGMTRPNQDDIARGASKVELYQCSLSDCRAQERFPRYGDVWAVMRSRRGRCGEWVSCFTMFCRALGAKVRWVWNAEDHVWTEVYSDHVKRWIHVDCCEGAWDQPRLYSEGWGKSMSYCIAFSADGATDVTRRYVRDPAKYSKPRNECPEEVLIWLLAELRRKKRKDLDKTEQARLLRDDAREEKELRSFVIYPLINEIEKLTIDEIARSNRQPPPPPTSGVTRQNSTTKTEERGERLSARTTGTEEWRRARGENGREERRDNR